MTRNNAAADEMLPPDVSWLEAQWHRALREAAGRPGLLVLDEVQKIDGWSEAVKALWDARRRSDAKLRVLILGSSALLLARGTAESLMGRFLLHRCTHWSWPECRDAFGWPLDRWLYFGGYPGAAALVDKEHEWRTYVRDALVEPTLARDVLALQNVARPALLRHLFVLACRFAAQSLSYNKMLGQLHDAGNTTTLADYLRLLETAFLLSGLERFSPGGARSRGSSPKLVVWNDALVTALGDQAFAELRAQPDAWGRLVENAVGGHLVNHLQGLPYQVTWWRERNDEVDYVVQRGAHVWGIEVKSGRSARAPGLRAFQRRVSGARPLIVGTGGVPIETFFAADPRTLFEA